MLDQKPLFRSINTRTRGVYRGAGGEYRWSRHARNEDMTSLGSMHANRHRGRDYTPLFRFLLTRVGRDWGETYREAVARLDKEEPIFWLVARKEEEKKPIVRIGENSFFSGLYVDDNNLLAVVEENIRVEALEPACPCCTHTFNGKPFIRKFSQSRERPDYLELMLNLG